jgi:signal peptidase II
MQATRGTSLSSEASSDGAVVAGAISTTNARRLFVVVALAAYALDLLTKVMAVAHLTPGEPVSVVGSLLRLDLVRNPGAAFSTGTSYTALLSLIALVAAGVVLRFGRRLGDPVWAVALGLLLAGVLGNLTDRLFRSPGFLRGHVVDFLELPHWPVFNVADMLIDVAVVLIIVQTWRGIGLSGRRPDAAS